MNETILHSILNGVAISGVVALMGEVLFRFANRAERVLCYWHLCSAVLAAVVVLFTLSAVPVFVLSWLGVSALASLGYFIAAKVVEKHLPPNQLPTMMKL